MSSWNYTTAPSWNPTATPSAAGWNDATSGELLVSIRDLSSKRTDANVAPTISSASLVGGNSPKVTGGTITVAVTFSEQVKVLGDCYVTLNVGAGTRKMVYDPALTVDNIVAFTYTVTASDVATAGQVTIANTITRGEGGNLVDVLNGGGEQRVVTIGTFTVPATNLITLN